MATEALAWCVAACASLHGYNVGGPFRHSAHSRWCVCVCGVCARAPACAFACTLQVKQFKANFGDVSGYLATHLSVMENVRKKLLKKSRTRRGVDEDADDGAEPHAQSVAIEVAASHPPPAASPAAHPGCSHSGAVPLWERRSARM